jgi:Transposase zinc-binding domain
MALTVQAILQQHYAAFAASHPLAAYQRDAAERLRDCRTAALGGHWRSCPNGHVHTAHYNSCHHRSCPLCAALERERWLAGWKERLLDCPHVHTVFTTPQDLVPLWRYNKKVFPELLFHAATDALRELLGDPKYMGGLPGLLAAN